MLTERSELLVKAGLESDFHAALDGRGRAILSGVEGVISVRLGRGVENPAKFLLLVEWRSMEAHTAYHATPACAELRRLMAPYLTGGSMEHFEIA